MKKFLLKTALYIILVFVILEFLVRTFNFHGDRILHANINNDYLLKPYQKGTFVRGTFGEIRSSFSINPQGFNSIRDYKKDEKSQKKKIALIGSSFIEGLHTNVENSIGRLLEKKFNQDIIIHEYGVGGSGSGDYELMYEKYNLSKYDLVFNFFSKNDLQGKLNAAINKPRNNHNPALNFIYSNFKSIQYLNQNHLIIPNLKKIFTRNIHGTVKIQAPHINGKNIFYVFIPLKAKLSSDEKRVLDNMKNLIYMKHTRKPYDFGFDYHWNLNGRINAAESISGTIKTQLY